MKYIIEKIINNISYTSCIEKEQKETRHKKKVNLILHSQIVKTQNRINIKLYNHHINVQDKYG